MLQSYMMEIVYYHLAFASFKNSIQYLNDQQNKINLVLINNKELVENLLFINNPPRKCIAWKSSIEKFLYEV